MNSFYSISWKYGAEKRNSVFTWGLFSAIRLLINIRKIDKSAEMHMFTGNHTFIKVFGGTK